LNAALSPFVTFVMSGIAGVTNRIAAHGTSFAQ